MFKSLLLLTSLALVALSNASTPTGDSICVGLMCISGTLNGSTVEYVLQSTGKQQPLGWMAIGFGLQMANTPMVILWPNSDGNITVSQRMAPREVMPTVDNNPPRIASLAQSLSSTSGTQPKLAFTVPADSTTQQSLIWAFGTTNPGSSAVDATLQIHALSGAGITLDLTKPLSSNTTTGDTPTSSSPNSSGSGSSSEPTVTSPLLPYQKVIVAHAIFVTAGFLLLLPAGALLARYLRTITPMWFQGHWVAQFGLAGPAIIVGVGLGIKAVQEAGSPHLNDDHKKWGVIIFALYFMQCALGAIIHWIKPKNARGRPPQNYLHAVLGLVIIGLALYQVRTGYKSEWPNSTGRGPLPSSINTLWTVWVILLPVLYAGGLLLLKRQFAQERATRLKPVPSSDGFDTDDIQLNSGASYQRRYHD